MNVSKFKLNKKAGFTLIELLVVISIISVLSSIVLASTKNVRAGARDATRKQTVHQMDLAIKLYANDKGYTPKIAGCVNDVLSCTAQSSDTNGRWSALKTELAPYMSKLPDSLNNIDYVYIAPNDTQDPSYYQISSALETTSGSNGQTGYSSLNSSGTLITIVSPNNPVLTASMSGPTTLIGVNSSGTWTITASNPNNDSLTYTITGWGDGYILPFGYEEKIKTLASYFINTVYAVLTPTLPTPITNNSTFASFSHTYPSTNGGPHNITYSVKNNNTGEIVYGTYVVTYYNTVI